MLQCRNGLDPQFRKASRGLALSFIAWAPRRLRRRQSRGVGAVRSGRFQLDMQTDLQKLRRYTGLNHLAQAARGVLESRQHLEQARSSRVLG